MINMSNETNKTTRPTEKIVFASEAKNSNNIPFMTVKDNNGYQYAERLGMDSVAFILLDKDRNNSWGLINERKPPMDCRYDRDVFMTTAFGGSLDSDMSAINTVQAETWEEAGYKVDIERITHLGDVLVSTQMNQMCKLYIVDVTGLEVGEGSPQNEMEAMAETVWCAIDKVITNEDWKATTILGKASFVGIEV
jgi:hypothetical protein